MTWLFAFVHIGDRFIILYFTNQSRDIFNNAPDVGYIYK